MKKKVIFAVFILSLGVAACTDKRGAGMPSENADSAVSASTEQQNDLQTLEKKYQAGTLDLTEYELLAGKLTEAGRQEDARNVLERAQLLSFSEERQQILDEIIVTLTQDHAEAAVLTKVYNLLKSGDTKTPDDATADTDAAATDATGKNQPVDAADFTNVDKAVAYITSEDGKNEILGGMPVGRRNYEYHVSDTAVLKLMFERTIYGEENLKLCLQDENVGYMAVSLSNTEEVICRAEKTADSQTSESAEMVETVLTGAFCYERRVATLHTDAGAEGTNTAEKADTGASQTASPAEMIMDFRHQGTLEDGHFTGAYECIKGGRTYKGEFDEKGCTKVEQKEEIKKEEKLVYADVTEGTNYYYLALPQTEDFVFTPESVGMENVELW